MTVPWLFWRILSSSVRPSAQCCEIRCPSSKSPLARIFDHRKATVDAEVRPGGTRWRCRRRPIPSWPIPLLFEPTGRVETTWRLWVLTAASTEPFKRQHFKNTVWLLMRFTFLDIFTVFVVGTATFLAIDASDWGEGGGNRYVVVCSCTGAVSSESRSCDSRLQCSVCKTVFCVASLSPPPSSVPRPGQETSLVPPCVWCPPVFEAEVFREKMYCRWRKYLWQC